MLNISVLLITNSTALSRVISNYLEDKNLEISITTDDEDYIKKIQREQPDVIITDAGTENIQAQTICKDLRRKFPHISQIVIAKSNEFAHINKFVKIPVDDFVIKPISPSILYLRIKNLFKNSTNGNELFKNGELTVDNVKKQVYINGEPIKVSPKEFRLIRYLVANKGKVLSRNNILNHVWGYDSYVIDRNVDVYVGYIRKKLSEKEKEEVIKTVPSFGYMMENLG